MSAGYKPVSWNRFKMAYDAVVLAAIVGYVLAYLRVGPLLARVTLPPDDATLAMKALGSCAFLLLTATLCIGPLARIDPRFLPLLYNRRHLGVLLFAVACAHAAQVLGWYFAFSPVPPTLALLSADTSYGHLTGFSFVAFGLAALAILAAMAATSHDWWLAFLTPPVWKALHMLVYAAYTLVVLHVAFGILQSTNSPLLPAVTAASVTLVAGLHLAAGLLERTTDRIVAPTSGTWVDAGPVDGFAEGRGVIVRPTGGEPVAIFRHEGRLSAVTNLCAHQNGPLGEGCVLDGLITCPWHGYQYRLADGCAPPPFTERLATYRLRLDGRRVMLDPRPNPPGTFVEPLPLPAIQSAAP